ncbi:hypothetical protein [Xylella fastidiosa]|nr:hypothetical protein [Xylella fastidiosa]WNY22622.1 hypothetical protein RO838_11935 [Xylella fastidiosa]
MGYIVIDFHGGINMAMAAGVDTSVSSMNSLSMWLTRWIPITANVLIIACAIAWIAQKGPVKPTIRIVACLAAIGSFSFFFGMFGLN